MQGVYNVTQLGVASGTSVVTLIEFETAATHAFEVLRAWIENETSEVSEQWACSFVRKSADGTNVTTPTVEPLDPASQSHGQTVRGMCTTVGTISATIMRRGFNVLNGFEWVATPEERIVVPAAGTFGLHLPVAPVTSTTISCGITVMRIA